MTVSVGIDIGGTFTDIIVCPDDGGAATIAKVPTTAHDPGVGLIEGLCQALDAAGASPAEVTSIVHGTTVGTNAVLQHDGARIGIITTEGFQDTLHIGRGKRRQMYDLFTGSDTPDFLCPPERVYGVPGRIAPDGTQIEPLDTDAVASAADELVLRHGVTAIAVSFLFSFVDTRHEQRAREIIEERHPGVIVSLSSRIDPRFREFERLVVTAMDAYIRPLIGRYIAGLRTRLADTGVRVPLQVMESHGGIVASELIEERAVGTLLSGLAGGAAGAAAIGRAAGRPDVLGFDMGGTSTDVAMIVDGQALTHDEGEIGGQPLRLPTVDVHTIGAGGGSVAYVDAAGSLCVGPRSAGSAPGPAAYGWGGTEPTVTDANLLLGFLGEEGLAGGSLRLSRDLAAKAIRQVAERLDMTEVATAWGVHRIACAAMAAAVRVVSVGRGHDPRNFALVASGGAGAMHACTIAADLGIAEILVPPHPGVLSAYGLLTAEVKVPRWRTFQHGTADLDPADLRARLDEIAAAARSDIERAGADPSAITVRLAVDARYVGQSHELTVPVTGGADMVGRLETDFADLHRRLYGQDDPHGRVEITAVRATAAAPGTDHRVGGHGGAPTRTERQVYLPETGGFATVPVLSRAGVTGELAGPAIVTQDDTTILVRSGWRARPAAAGTLILTRPVTGGRDAGH
ncbi:hydantoinase/oxoprolinase family protein [Actinomadura rugatobispora]|uniref:Hydantoinase/oxoprolinase family protein n=1 Tax=Actinomadura rugatobispora TaxID=1994 RepID=A0ABW1A7D3_9ACTN|nr:hydantoinase/oxoprolinase family protein [Actinomadura rugatobispora]